MMAAPKGNQYAKGSKGGGRRTTYQAKFAEMARKACKAGFTDADLAELLGVSERTINTWKTKHKEFSAALKSAKDDLDEQVEHSLFERAMGYSHPEDKIFLHDGKPVVVPTEKRYAPDTTAQIFWLKNRQPERWRDKSEHSLGLTSDMIELLKAIQKMDDDDLAKLSESL